MNPLSAAAPPPAGAHPVPPPGRSRRRWWPWLAGGVWAVLVVAAAFYAAASGGSSIREQTTIGQALPTVDAAVADLVTAADGPSVVAAVGGYVQVGGGPCRLTAVDRGVRYEREVLFFTASDGEAALARQLAEALPPRYRARAGRSAASLLLSADAGNYVTVTGRRNGPGQVRVVVDTGCRRLDGTVVGTEPELPAPDAPPAARAPVEAVLAALPVPAARWSVQRVACPGGGQAWTVRADVEPGNVEPGNGEPGNGVAGSLAERLAPVASAPLVARPDLVAYRAGPAGVAVRTHETGGVIVTATTGCR